MNGRRDELVQVAGVNVSPGEVRRKIGLLPGMAEVAIRLGPERLTAFVSPGVTVHDLPAFEGAVHADILACLPAPARVIDLWPGAAAQRHGQRLRLGCFDPNLPT